MSSRLFSGAISARSSTNRTVSFAAALKELYTEDAIFSDHFGNNVGHGAIDAAVAKLHERLPGFVLKERGKPEALENAGRIRWQFGPHGFSESRDYAGEIVLEQRQA
jgi:hypothetical protein